MPNIYLSPSSQEFNKYINGETEEYYMNLIVDKMIPYLEANDIQFKRNTKDMAANSSVVDSNKENYDLHLAIHSNAAGGEDVGKYRGTQIYYYPTSTKGKRAAEIIAKNFKRIYPLPDQVKTVPTTRLGEVSQTKAPAVLMEVVFHDNIDDANWMKENIDTIAQNIVESVREYFYMTTANKANNSSSMKINGDGDGNIGTVNLTSGYLNIRKGPFLDSPIIATAPNGATLTVLYQTGDWYIVLYEGIYGYAYSKYISL